MIWKFGQAPCAIARAALLLAALLLPRPGAAQPDGPASTTTYDILIYGGTSAAMAAAVGATRAGRSVAIVCPERHLGGMTTNGLGWTDSGNKAVIGGLAREFYQRVKRHYDDPGAWPQDERDRFGGYRAGEDAMWVFEPHVAEAIVEEMLGEAGVPTIRGRRLDRSGAGVEKRGARIVAIRMEGGETYRARVFIDATYEGDLMAAAGVTYTVGREANSVYGETLNGVQAAHAIHHQFAAPVDPYVIPGDPASGLLPRIHAGGPGEEGEGDWRVQAYTYRLCMTRVAENRVPFEKPEGYDPGQYELLLRHILASPDAPIHKPDPMPNGKTDTNNSGAFSTDNIGMNAEYPEASYERREEILAEHERYQRGFYYFLANDPRVPEGLRARMAAWGLAADEFTDNHNWPHQIYVREARRMVSDFVTTEPHLKGEKPTPRPIGMGSYNMDSHNVQRYVAIDDQGRAVVRNEGDIQVNPGGPYPIAYDAIVPRRSECDNLLVPVCVSSSHIAYGSIRMEPVFMILGQSAGAAAAIAVECDLPVQTVPYDDLSFRLLAGHQVLGLAEPARPAGLDASTLPGVVIDDTGAIREGEWLESASVPGFVGGGYLHDGNAGKGSCALRFGAVTPHAGAYEVRLAYTAHENRAGGVPVTVEAGGRRTEVRVDQRLAPPLDGMWIALGRVAVEAGAVVVVRVSNAGTDGYVVADAVQLLPLP